MSAGRYALAALDMDGTLLNTAHEITPFTREALDRAAAAGKVVALCTGRSLSELWAHFEALPAVTYAICENGGCLYDVRGKRVLRQVTIPDAESARILDLAAGYDLSLQCFIGGQSYMQLTDPADLARWHIADFYPVFRAGSVFVPDIRALWREKGGPAEKFNLFFTGPGDRDDFARCLGGTELRLAGSLGVGWEISPPEATKGLGLLALCRHLGIDVAEAMAVGDGGNDLELMQTAGFAVAMGNAEAPVRAAAHAVTDDCDHDGAAKAVLRYMLGEK